MLPYQVVPLANYCAPLFFPIPTSIGTTVDKCDARVSMIQRQYQRQVVWYYNEKIYIMHASSAPSRTLLQNTCNKAQSIHPVCIIDGRIHLWVSRATRLQGARDNAQSWCGGLLRHYVARSPAAVSICCGFVPAISFLYLSLPFSQLRKKRTLKIL